MRSGPLSLTPLLGLLGLLTACGGGQEPASVVATADGGFQVLSGQVEKGPLLRGSSVTINTLTTAPVLLAANTTTVIGNATATTLPALVPTGASFSMEVKDDYGSFAPQSAGIFQSSFIETTAEGYYLNELTGQRSSDQIALRGLSNLKSDKAINVNLLTDLSKERTLALARAGAGTGTVTSAIFDTARRQAQTETLRAFNIDLKELGTVNAFAEMDLKKISTEPSVRPADGILLALSSLALQVGQNGSGLSDFINRFEADLADNGVIDDVTLKNQILQASAAVDFDRVAANMNRFYTSTKFVPADIARWVDRSGGVIGVLQKNVQYIPNLAYASGTVYESNTVTVAGTDAAACYGAELNSAANGTVQLLDGTTVKANGSSYPLTATTTSTLKLRFTPTSPAAIGFLVRWDRVSGACSLSNQPNKSRLLAYAAVPTDVGLFLNKLGADFANCYALASTARVLAVDNTLPSVRGGPAVTNVAEACKPMVSSQTTTGTEFLQNGYNSGQYFYGMLTDASLTRSAKISDIEILRSSTAPAAPLASRPTLVLSVKYLDRYNRMGSFITVAQKIAGTSGASGDWWITGNQQSVDVNLMPLLRKFSSVANYTTATPSTKEHYRSALGVFASAFGPGSRLADGSALSAVRVTGPGVPGLVLVPPIQAGQTWMDISNAGGDVAGAGSRRCGAALTVGGTPFSNCPYYWIARSTSVVPSGAAPAVRSPGATEGSCSANLVNQTCAWGSTWSPTDVSAQLTRNTGYTVELFYGGRSTPTYSYDKYLNSTLPSLASAHTAGWVALDTASITAGRPVAGQTALDLAWTGQVANQVEVKSLTVSLNTPTAAVASPDDPVLRGMSQGSAAPGSEIQYQLPSAITGATTQRSLLLNLRTWDGSAKSLWFSYDTAN